LSASRDLEVDDGDDLALPPLVVKVAVRQRLRDRGASR